MRRLEDDSMRTRIVERLVIRGEDPREPVEGFMKWRAFLVAFTPAAIAFGVLYALEVDAIAGWILPIVLAVAGIKFVGGPINKRIRELEREEGPGPNVDVVAWCPNCQTYADPDEKGECRECAHHVAWRDAREI